MIGFSNMANLFDCDGAPYSYLHFLKVIPIKFWVVYIQRVYFSFKGSLVYFFIIFLKKNLYAKSVENPVCKECRKSCMQTM